MYQTLAKTLTKAGVSNFCGDLEDDVETWIFSLERHFKKVAMQEEEKLDFAIDFLKKGALATYRSWDNNDNFSWYDFNTAS